jgi:hypothetical protein
MLRYSVGVLACCISLVPCLLLISHAQAVDYVNDIKPLLEEKCYACHGPLKSQAGLRLDTAKRLIAGGDSGNAVVAGKPHESLLIDVLTGEAGYQMPPANEGAAMTAEQVELVRKWILAGAPAPEDEQPAPDPKKWWSYQPIERPPLPSLDDADWCQNPIDQFIQARREENGLPHASRADRATWLRRVYLDLIGLPPSRDQLQMFIDDPSANAEERVVDELLSRPEYGQRWGRHWMDVWRYSDWYGSRGINEVRYSQRHIWRWRDWIVDALNADLGYDQMVRQMLAADESDFTDAGQLAATGYLGRNWYKFDRDVWLFDTVERTSEALLGLTMRCCRCHDHKFDPISQVEYYRFRACFEPHDVRIDPVSATAEREKDATLGMVLTDGIPLVYDKTSEAPTYLFERGDSRAPDKSQVLQPGIPAALSGAVSGSLDVQPIDLQPEVWYPMLRSDLRKSLLQKMADDVQLAIAEREQAQIALQTLLDKMPTTEIAKRSADTDDLQHTASQDTASPADRVLLSDDFATENLQLWKPLSGEWRFVDGKLLQSSVTSFATIVAEPVLPLDFAVQIRYRTLAPGTYRSVGFSFDYKDQGNSQDVYTSANDNRSSVQAFHRSGGQQSYPAEGIVYTPLDVGQEITLDVRVVGTSLTIDLNGERKLDYAMPLARRAGKFALWVHQGAAEFLEVKISGIEESEESRRQQIDDAQNAVRLADLKIQRAEAHQVAMQKRIDAEMAKHLNLRPDGSQLPATEKEATANQLALAAAVATADAEILDAKLKIEEVAGDAKQLAEAETRLAKAQQAASNPQPEGYQPIGDQYPTVSSGRRLALARWITDRENPRTARVAVNHLWGRHFGQPLVATPENFGLNGQTPSHPKLLDWLADELMRNDWQMKPLHKLIVLSATYRMSSQTPLTTSDIGSRLDPENRLLWKMPLRRMEAEVVRDSTLWLADRLDRTFGGPEIPEDKGDQVFRRSLYIRNTPNEKNPMLEIFDIADPNACYRRQESIVPHQSLAMMNSGLSKDAARIIADRLPQDEAFINAAFETVLSRKASPAEHERCHEFLQSHANLLQRNAGPTFNGNSLALLPPDSDPMQQARENLVHVLLLHNDFVTVR